MTCSPGARDMDLPSPPRQRRKRRKRKVGASVTAPTFNLCCFNANGVCCRETLLKKFLKDNGISFCGILESHTYRNHELSCKGWIWDPGIENRPNLTQPYPRRHWEPLHTVSQHQPNLPWKILGLDENRTQGQPPPLRSHLLLPPLIANKATCQGLG